MQAAYVQSGGSDPGLLAQMMDLQREAQRLEQAPLEAEAKGRRKSESFRSTQRGRIDEIGPHEHLMWMDVPQLLDLTVMLVGKQWLLGFQGFQVSVLSFQTGYE